MAALLRDEVQDNTQITARAVALVYNWWSWYVRAADPQARREALKSRPLLLAAIGRATGGGDDCAASSGVEPDGRTRRRLTANKTQSVK